MQAGSWETSYISRTSTGINFLCIANGEEPKTAIIAAISEKGEVVTHESKRHGFEDGDFVSFNEVEGMEGINGEKFEIVVTGPHAFKLKLPEGMKVLMRRFQLQKSPKKWKLPHEDDLMLKAQEPTK